MSIGCMGISRIPIGPSTRRARSICLSSEAAVPLRRTVPSSASPPARRGHRAGSTKPLGRYDGRAGSPRSPPPPAATACLISSAGQAAQVTSGPLSVPKTCAQTLRSSTARHLTRVRPATLQAGTAAKTGRLRRGGVSTGVRRFRAPGRPCHPSVRFGKLGSFRSDSFLRERKTAAPERSNALKNPPLAQGSWRGGGGAFWRRGVVRLWLE